MVHICHGLLKFGKKIEIIDPFFSLHKKVEDFDSRALITEFFDVIKDYNCCSILRIHFKDHQKLPNIHFVAQSISSLGWSLPKGMLLEIFCWQKNPTIEFHDRYLVTDKGGLSLGAGFVPKPGETTTVTRLSRTKSQEVVNRFSFNDIGHTLIDPGLRIYSDGSTELID